MDQEEILAFIMQVETDDVDPLNVARAYAATVDDVQSRISAQDMRRLLLIGAAMYRNGIKGQHAELQMPVAVGQAESDPMLDSAKFNGIRH